MLTSPKSITTIVSVITVLILAIIGLVTFNILNKQNNPQIQIGIDNQSSISSMSLISQTSKPLTITLTSASVTTITSSPAPVVQSPKPTEQPALPPEPKPIVPPQPVEIPTFDSRYQTSLQLQTPNQITSIRVGKCDLQTKFKTGLCEILDQNNQIVFLFNSWVGIPLLIDSTTESKTILNISQPYIACSISKYQFSYSKKELATILNLNSQECNDPIIKAEIDKYKTEYDKLNNPNN